MQHAYPINLDVTQRQIVIVGGGAVAARKAAGLLAAGAQRITAVAPHFSPDFPQVSHRIAEDYAARHLAGAELVFVATDSPEVNEAAAQDAKKIGALVNRADDQPGDFLVPALLQRQGLMVAVSAGGAPTLATAVRDEIDARLGPYWSELAEALGLLRLRIRQSELTISQRRDILRSAASPDAIAAFQQGGYTAWHDWLVRKFPALTIP